MSGRDMKNITYIEEHLKISNEPEEGEIVDEYDLIVSSDEELCMRQRIRELEAKNEEIEQIDVISRSYVNKINHPHRLESSRAAQVPTDVSSISSTEFVTPKKRKRRKSREHKRKHCHRQHQHELSHQYEQTVRYDVQQLPPKTRSKRTHCKRKQKLFAKKHKKNHSDRFIHKEVNAESLSIESLESSDSSSLSDTDNYSSNWLALKRKEEPYNKGEYITRDTLRLAVARNTNESRLNSKRICLKDKLLRQEVGHPSNKAINERYAFVEERVMGDDNIDEDDDVQVIENEPDIQTVDEDSTDSMEEKELRLIALKSAVLKKHMARKMRNAAAAYSPTDFDEMLSSAILGQDNKQDDIEVVDLEDEDSQSACATISPVASPQFMILEDQEESQHMVDCKPVDMDISNSDSEGAAIDIWSKDVEPSLHKYSFDSSDFSKNFQYDFYMESLRELPPPPPGVDNYEDAPPPPPYHMVYNADNEDMNLDNEELVEEEKRTVNDVLPQIECLKKEESEDEEEEEALRALLLSKFQSPKNQKRTKSPKKVVPECKDTSNINIEPERNHHITKPTEFILKEAVKRLKVHSKTEVCKEEATVDSDIKPKSRIDGKTEEYSENNIDSLKLLEKLRNRLNVYKTQFQSTNTDQFKGETNEYNSEGKETAANFCNRVSEEPTIMSNTPEVTSTIDICDITRRLQKIKENVLNSTYNISSKDPQTCLNSKPPVDDVGPCISENTEDTENVKECNQSSIEVGCEVDKPLSNNSVNIVPVKNEFCNALAKHKTVKANFDVTTNQTIFKVTITNNAALKSEDNHIPNTHNVTYEENNVNNVPKSATLKINGNIKSKVASSSERLVIITNKNTESRSENIAELNKPLTVAKSVMNDIKVSPTPTYSLLRSKKIIKPNKVINANFVDSIPKPILQPADSKLVPNNSKPEVSNKLSKVSDNSRLITSIDQVKHMCKIPTFVISLQNSSNESSEDEWAGDYNSLYKPLYDYNDNVSPLSLNLESPSRTPLRSNSPIDPCAEESIEHTDFEAFNLKTKITSIHKENIVVTTPPANSAKQGEKISKTPLAVRHLPAAAQSEYRRLVHRMTLLENKRKVSNIEENEKECSSKKKTCSSLAVTDDPSKENDKTETLKTSLVKKVLLKNASNSTTSNAAQIPNGSSSIAKQHRNDVLRSYENLYIKFGVGIVNNLDKSLKLVEEAKKAKLAKLKLENRLKELKAEMDILQSKHKEEQQKISRIYPNICTTNEIITSLKQKRSKVFKATVNLGKTLKGETYRLNNDLKEIITTKSNKLATEIKNVNSLKVQNVKNVEALVKRNNTTKEQQQHTDNKEKQIEIEDRTTKSNTNNVEIKPNPNTTANNTMICSERCNEEEEKNNLEPILKSEDGGNTENLKHNDKKSDDDNSVYTGRPDVDTNFNNACSEKDSEQALPSYISPLEHLRNIDSNVDPNGVVCPYDLMGNCEDVTCKYVHITPKAKS